MTGWRGVELYGTFIKITGELEVLGIDRLSDAINRYGDFLAVRRGRAEPLGAHRPLVGAADTAMTVAKRTVLLVCPTTLSSDGTSVMWREKTPCPAVITTTAFSVAGEIHLSPGHTLQDELERNPGHFIPLSNFSALWHATLEPAPLSLQRPFGLLNPAAIISFSFPNAGRS
jgi:hypothetical protein